MRCRMNVTQARRGKFEGKNPLGTDFRLFSGVNVGGRAAVFFYFSYFTPDATSPSLDCYFILVVNNKA